MVLPRKGAGKGSIFSTMQELQEGINSKITSLLITMASNRDIMVYCTAFMALMMGIWGGLEVIMNIGMF